MQPNMIIAGDNIIIRWKWDNTQILLIKRLKDPFRDCWAFPAGRVESDETIKTWALRELREETGIVLHDTEFFWIYDDPERDPRGRTVSVMFFSRIPDDTEFQAADDAKECEWFNIHKLPRLAFDHEKVIRDFIQFLRKKWQI